MPTKISIDANHSKNLDILDIPLLFPSLTGIALKDVADFSFLNSLLSLTTLHLSGIKMALNDLPTTVKELKLNGTVMELNGALQNLPNLEVLEITERTESKRGKPSCVLLNKESLLTFLPPSLVHLQLPHNILTPAQSPVLPPSLVSVRMTQGTTEGAFYINTMNADSQRKYPPTLTYLYLHLPSIPSVNFPPHLTHFHIKTNEFKQELQDLPQSLKYLTIEVASFEQQLNNLPSNLVSFYLSFDLVVFW
jgi:hypothetical protein